MSEKFPCHDELCSTLIGHASACDCGLDALLARVAELERERDELRTQLEAWHSIFETTQLTHAGARLEAAESGRAKAERDLVEALDAVLRARWLMFPVPNKLAEEEREWMDRPIVVRALRGEKNA